MVAGSWWLVATAELQVVPMRRNLTMVLVQSRTIGISNLTTARICV